MAEDWREGTEEEVRAALARHGYDPGAAPCGLSARAGDEGKTWLSANRPPVLLRYRVCVLDGILIDGHGASDLDPAGGCIHCGWDPDDGETEGPPAPGPVKVRTTFQPWREIEVPAWEAASLRAQGLLVPEEKTGEVAGQ